VDGAIEPTLVHLVKLRASQLNGCAYCLDMHWKDLRAAGESEQRLYSLDAWQECPFYSARERAALAWTDAYRLAPRTVCMISPENAPSIRLAERVGFAPYAVTTYKGADVTLFQRMVA